MQLPNTLQTLWNHKASLLDPVYVDLVYPTVPVLVAHGIEGRQIYGVNLTEAVGINSSQKVRRRETGSDSCFNDESRSGCSDNIV